MTSESNSPLLANPWKLKMANPMPKQNKHKINSFRIKIYRDRSQLK
jgi:hypothetical protein